MAAIVNTKLPQVGELLVKKARAALQEGLQAQRQGRLRRDGDVHRAPGQPAGRARDAGGADPRAAAAEADRRQRRDRRRPRPEVRPARSRT